MKRIKEILKDSKLYIFSAITLIFFGFLYKLEYSVDSYPLFQEDTNTYFDWFIKSGRFISAIILKTLRSIGLGDADKMYYFSFLMAIILMIISLYILYDTLKDDIKNKILKILIPILIVINVFVIELFMFWEKGIMILGILANIIAFKYFKQFLEGNKKGLIIVFIANLLANFSYQGVVSLFVVLSSVYIVKNSKNFIQFIKNNIILGIFYTLPAAINYFLVKFLFANARVSSNLNLLESAKKILIQTKNVLIGTSGIIPKYIFLIALITVILINIYVFIKNKKYLKILGMIYIIFISYIISVAPQILVSYESIALAPRTIVSIGAILGILMLNIADEEFKTVNIQKIVEKFAILVAIFILFVQYIGFTRIIRDRYIVNYVDYYIGKQIRELVENYENENNIKIKKVHFYTKKNNEYTYEKIKLVGDTNLKATFPDWARDDYLHLYLGKKLDIIEENKEIFEKYFKNRNWKYFDKEQVVFLNDELHLYIY